MTNRNQPRLDNAVFNIASNLFGYGNTEAKKTLEKEIAIERVISEKKPFTAVYPAIIEEAFAMTMDNFRKEVAQKNAEYKEKNKIIDAHNSFVKLFRKQTQLTEVQVEYSRIFVKNNKTLNSTEYNNKADTFNEEYGLLVEKKKHATIKYATELIFQNLLCLYNQQLMVKNKRYMGHGITTATPLEPFKLNAWKVTKLKRNGVDSLPVCTKTIRNHRQRLEEFGIFTDYHFNGVNRPVEVQIKPTILVIKDLHTGKIALIDNQSVKEERGKILPEQNESTRTYLKENQRKEVDNSTTGLGLPSVGRFIFFTGTPSGNEGNSTEGAAPETVKVSPKSENIIDSLSDKLQKLIGHTQELAVGLASGNYNNYKPIRLEYLEKEAYGGTLLNAEFRELCIQDTFKMAAKIWKNSTPYAGSWKMAINSWYDHQWFFQNNKDIAMNKAAIFEKVREMRWRLLWAMKWFQKNPEVKPLFPHDYFDFSRKTNKEVGFEYTRKKWKEHLSYKEKAEAFKKKQEIDGKNRLKMQNFSKKFETVVNNFFKDKMTLTELYNHVEKNFPAEFREKLPQKIEQKALKRTEKVHFVQYDLHDF